MTTADLRRLLADATPGPWVHPDPSWDSVWVTTDRCIYASHDAPEARFDAALIVAAVNALPGLLDRLEAADRLATAARDASPWKPMTAWLGPLQAALAAYRDSEAPGC